MFNSIICRPNRSFTSDKFIIMFMASFDTLFEKIDLRSGRGCLKIIQIFIFSGKVRGEVALTKIKKLID